MLAKQTTLDKWLACQRMDALGPEATLIDRAAIAYITMKDRSVPITAPIIPQVVPAIVESIRRDIGTHPHPESGEPVLNHEDLHEVLSWAISRSARGHTEIQKRLFLRTRVWGSEYGGHKQTSWLNEYSYQNDAAHGVCTLRSASGKPTEITEYKWGRRNGTRLVYSRGELWRKETYFNGALHGETIVYEPSAKTMRMWYAHGALIGSVDATRSRTWLSRSVIITRVIGSNTGAQVGDLSITRSEGDQPTPLPRGCFVRSLTAPDTLTPYTIHNPRLNVIIDCRRHIGDPEASAELHVIENLRKIEWALRDGWVIITTWDAPMLYKYCVNVGQGEWTKIYPAARAEINTFLAAVDTELANREAAGWAPPLAFPSGTFCDESFDELGARMSVCALSREEAPVARELIALIRALLADTYPQWSTDAPMHRAADAQKSSSVAVRGGIVSAS